MSNVKQSPSRNKNRSNMSEKGPKTPLIQVTEVFHPDDTDVDNIISPRRLPRSDIPTIGIDNLSFDPSEDVVHRVHEDYNTQRELCDIHTPLPNVPYVFASNRRGSNSNVFVFDPDCVSLYSRRGSGASRRGSAPTGADKSSLAVPTLKQIRTGDFYDSNVLLPGYNDTSGDSHLPPPRSPGIISTQSAWSELLNINTCNSRRSSEGGLSDLSRVSNVSSSLSEHLRNLVRAFSSRTEKVKECTLQPPSPSSLSDYAGSDALSANAQAQKQMKYLQIRIFDMFAAISAEPQFRRRLDSFLPDQPEGDTISEIVRIRNESEEEEKKKFKLPRWIRRLKFPHVIEPQSKLYLLWLFIVTLAFMYNAWAIPLRAAFPYQTPGNVKYWLACDYVCDFIYIVDILLFKMRISFLNSGLKETHRSKTRANYMQKKMFKFDCLSLLPLDLLYLIEMKVNPWCRLPRVLKIQTFWEFYSRCDHLVRSAHAVRIMRTFTYMLFLIHVETCGYYAMSVYEGLGVNEWVYNGEGNAYIRCFYLATKTATSIGNNPTPQNSPEYMFMTVYWVSGVFVFALLIGQIRDIFDASNMVKTTYNHRMDQALNYVKNMNVPKETQDRVRTWFIYNWQQQKVIDERSMMDALPMKLRKDLAIHVHFNTLSKVKLFSDCDKTLLYDLVLKLKPILYLPGDYVCKKGEIGKEMYIVSQGIVEVVGGPNNSLVLATLREGSVFGEISLLAMAAEGNRRTADVRCKGFTNLFILSKVDFENAMKDYPEAHKLLKKRAKKLLRMNARIERQSQCSVDQSKINATNIIHTPPETPKLVQTVLQVMDPGSTLVRKLSSRRGSKNNGEVWPSKNSEAPDVADNGADETCPDINNRVKSVTQRDDAEDFYDKMLSDRDWSNEQVKVENEVLAKMGGTSGKHRQEGEKDSGEANDLRTNKKTEVKDTGSRENSGVKSPGNSSQKKKTSDSSVRDTKVTSPGSSTVRSLSNKDSKDSFNSADLAGILEDDSGDSDSTEPTTNQDHSINYTAEMFGDIEAHPSRVKSGRSRRAKKTYRATSGKMGGSSCLLKRNDEYAKAFANGFTIIIDSVDDKENYSRDCFSPESSDSGEDDTFDCDDLLEDSDDNDQKEQIVKTVTFEDRPTKENVDTDTTKIVKNKPSSAPLPKTTSVYTKKSTKPVAKPVSAGVSKPCIQSKNKLGLKLKIENEKTPDFTPYLKSSTGRGKSQTNKARQQYNMSKQKNNSKNTSNGTKPVSGLADRTRTDKKNGSTVTKVTKDTSPLEVERTNSGGSTRSIAVAEADDSHSVNNVETCSQSPNQVTCFADVHREKTMSANSTQEEMVTLFSPDMVASGRQRKISVISIGSVLKDSRETLV
ncbi:uncharacterized protein LOC123549328 isoform X2 [Mercenaria mercenaria]|uniref:uncharacterized protein LOC123549328 isoform X2 n=1 Tax=Mercenaria mercenaria TaxID=6596 RepID=UPI00234EB6BE|nr:uncharacterized protein LOC123549328 isoform X2 [Mercenaria mercenaria]